MNQLNDLLLVVDIYTFVGGAGGTLTSNIEWFMLAVVYSSKQVVRMAWQTLYGSQFELGRRSSR